MLVLLIDFYSLSLLTQDGEAPTGVAQRLCPVSHLSQQKAERWGAGILKRAILLAYLQNHLL